MVAFIACEGMGMKPPSRFTEEQIIGILPGAQGGSEHRGRVSQVPNQQRGLLKMEGLVCGLGVLLAEFVAAAQELTFCVPTTPAVFPTPGALAAANPCQPQRQPQ